MLTQERADVLTNYLTADAERGQALLDMEPAEAMERINADGYDFNLEEINEYARALKMAQAGGELNAEELDDVAGGFGVLAAGGCILGGAVVGYVVTKW